MARLPSRHRPPASTVIPLPRDVMPALRAAGSHGIARRAAGSSVTSHSSGTRRGALTVTSPTRRVPSRRRTSSSARTCRRGCARSAGRGAGRSAGAGSCGASRRCAGGTRAASASRWCRPPGAAGASRAVWRPCYAGARQPEPASSSAAGGRRDSRAHRAGLGRCGRTTATAADFSSCSLRAWGLRAGHGRSLGSCVGSAYGGGQPCAEASERSS